MRDLSCGVNNWFYSKLVKANIQVHVEMFVSLQDQLERRSANYVMLGGSHFTAQWGHAIDFAAVASGTFLQRLFTKDDMSRVIFSN